MNSQSCYYLKNIFLSHRNSAIVILVLLVGFQSIQAIDFKCDYVTSYWYVVDTIKNCYGRQIDIRVPQTEIESINGNNATQDSRVLGFWIENEIAHYLPRNIEKFFPALIAFGVSNTGLKQLSKFDLQPFPQLLRLVFFRTQLEYLEADVFMYSGKVQSITLTDNNLFIIGHDIFESLPHLTYADIEIRCLKSKCEQGRRCFENLTSDLKRNCPSDSVVFNFKQDIQRLENELSASRARENALKKQIDNTSINNFDIRLLD